MHPQGKFHVLQPPQQHASSLSMLTICPRLSHRLLLAPLLTLHVPLVGLKTESKAAPQEIDTPYGLSKIGLS